MEEDADEVIGLLLPPPEAEVKVEVSLEFAEYELVYRLIVGLVVIIEEMQEEDVGAIEPLTTRLEIGAE